MAGAERTREDWPEAMAEVTECRYDVRAGRALAFGLISSKHFRITFNYRLGDELYTGECFSETARPQGTLFPIHYDPHLPHLHRSGSLTQRRGPLLSIGIAGTIIISLLGLLALRGCSLK